MLCAAASWVAAMCVRTGQLERACRRLQHFQTRASCGLPSSRLTQRIRGVSDASRRDCFAISTLALSSLSSQAAWQGVALLALVLDAAEKLAFVSFETGRTTALASARQNGCIPALLLLKKHCSLQCGARGAGAK